MARIHHVKRAQPRYRTVPVLNEDGTQKMVPVINRRTGQQKVTKRGKPIFKRVTKADLSQPLPLNKCESCGKEIQVGDPYKHVTPKSSAYGGRTRIRCAACPTWQPWDLSYSLGARIQQIQHDHGSVDGESRSDYEEAAQQAAEAIRELAEEKREAAQNMEDGFGHPTSQSEDLMQVADDLDSWADEVENVDIPDEPEEDTYASEDDEGEIDQEAYDAAMDEWRDEADSAYDDVLGNAPC